VLVVVLRQSKGEKNNRDHQHLGQLKSPRDRIIQEIATADVGDGEKHQECKRDTAEVCEKPVND
jgi:hypothetical protein